MGIKCIIWNVVDVVWTTAIGMHPAISCVFVLHKHLLRATARHFMQSHARNIPDCTSETALSTG